MISCKKSREKAVPPQVKRGLATAGVTFWQKGGLHPGAGLTGVVILAFASHSEAHFLIQECIRHTEAALTPFLGLDGRKKIKIFIIPSQTLRNSCQCKDGYITALQKDYSSETPVSDYVGSLNIIFFLRLSQNSQRKTTPTPVAYSHKQRLHRDQKISIICREMILE